MGLHINWKKLHGKCSSDGNCKKLIYYMYCILKQYEHTKIEINTYTLIKNEIFILR